MHFCRKCLHPIAFHYTMLFTHPKIPVLLGILFRVSFPENSLWVVKWLLSTTEKFCELLFTVFELSEVTQKWFRVVQINWREGNLRRCKNSRKVWIFGRFCFWSLPSPAGRGGKEGGGQAHAYIFTVKQVDGLCEGNLVDNISQLAFWAHCPLGQFLPG